VVFNSEIYNHLEIRQELDLLRADRAWRGHSDTETLLEALAEWGLHGALQRCTGMFAFAVWDRQTRTLHLARDRLGEKPLYYGWLGGALIFASELKAIRRHPAFRGEIDRAALSLLMRYNYVPAPYSIYKGICKLPAATTLTVTAADSRTPDRCEPTAYWTALEQVRRGHGAPLAATETEVIQELDATLRKAIGQQMLADVPLGAFLSGGIDSSTIVALMQAQSSRPVKTFSIGFHEAGYDEAVHARAVAAHLGTSHTELYVTPQQALAVIPRLPQIYDEPFCDSSQIPTYLVAQLARQHVTVALSGDGGDELFGGYNRYSWGRRIWKSLAPVPLPLRRAAAAAVTSVSPRSWDRVHSGASLVSRRVRSYGAVGDKLHKLAGVVRSRSADEVYMHLVSHWRDPGSVVVNGAANSLTGVAQLDGSVQDYTERMMLLDSVTYLPDDILVKVDRAAMAVSLESRVPFLDHHVFALAWRIPLSMKIREGKGKWILRQLLDRYVPRALIERPKMGFGVPIDTWLRGPLREWAEDLLSESRLAREGFFVPAAVRLKWQEHLSGTRNWQYLLWSVLMFQAWLEVQP
jgi:asparagine synthase (glutamine-hydrolysing)